MVKERERDRPRERERDMREVERDTRERDRAGRDRRRGRSPPVGFRRKEGRDLREPRERSRSRGGGRRKSRSPRKERKRSREHRHRSRRSRSGGRRSKRAKGDTGGKDEKEEGEEEQKVDFTADITPEDVQMMQAMGIPFGFDSSKGKDVKEGSAKLSAVRTKSLRQARQYMNRKGGFNRPLPSERTNEKVIRD